METHFSTEELSLLIEGLYEGLDMDRIKKHMAACERCRQVYRDAVGDRGVWQLEENAFPTSAELIAAGDAVASPPAPGTTEIPTWASRKTRGRMPLVLVAASVVFVVASLMFLRDTRVNEVVPLDASITEPIRAAIEATSARGGMIIPGGENFSSVKSDPLRSGDAPDGLEASVDHLRESISDGDSGVEAYYWFIAGLLAGADRNEARVQLMAMPDAYRSDPRIKSLAAVVHFANGNMDLAEASLRELSEDDPEDAVDEFNLAVVLAAKGNTDEAVRHFESVAKKHPDTPIAKRAQQLLSALNAD